MGSSLSRKPYMIASRIQNHFLRLFWTFKQLLANWTMTHIVAWIPNALSYKRWSLQGFDVQDMLQTLLFD